MRADAKPGELLAVLNRIEQDLLPALLRTREGWKSLYVDYEPPFVERLYVPVTVDDVVYRLMLHKIHPADPAICLFHPHPWPSAIKILSGSYRMTCGFGQGMVEPPVSHTMVLMAGAEYEMAHPDGWHSVSPLNGPSHSIMLIGPPWSRPAHKPPVAQRALTPEEARSLMEFFRDAYGI